ncbi:MAG TPA: prenyltransferase/squalene oxidase repeat-containing protein [Thermoguttaceae bacterium]|nr:prenyltransferase/squalene oxidase repeat-containing protein [Thermoguttaceae bacterium]
MDRLSLRGLRSKALAAGLAILIGVVTSRPASGYTPSSREVRDAVARAVKFLEARRTDSSGTGYEDTRPGACAVVGIALLKNGAPPNHPRVVSAAAQLQRSIDRAGDPSKLGFDIYSTALSIIFFVTLDADRYRSEIDSLLRYLGSVQKDHGGWGYSPPAKTGDTSMTQNAILGLWEAEKARVPISYEMVDRALVWLLKTQDPSGAFGYQGTVSNDFTPVQQTNIKPSMSGAGLGSLYLCADLLRIGKPKKDDELPPGMRKVEAKRSVPKSRVNAQLVQQALSRGKAWMEKNFVIEQPTYHLYNLYTVERYHTFREEAEGNVEKEPAWYDDGVRYLLKNQQDDGSWKDQSGETPATAFGILFLIRSTKISVTDKKSFGDGTLVGGKGLPKTTAGMARVEGNLVSKPELGSLDKMLAALDDASTPDALEALAMLPSDEAADLASKHAKKLRELAGAMSAEARLASVRALGKRRDLDNVPALLYALTDPVPAVVREARDSLRRISCKFDGFGMPDEPTELERHAAIRKWQEWYLAIRPDAELEY